MARDELHFDLSCTATRQAIFGRTIELLDKPEKTRIAYVVDDESIPASLHLNNFDEVCTAIDTTVASDFAKSEAKEVYRILAEAEAKVHGCEVSETHFHEVGEAMTCRAILGICTAIELIAPEKITATPVQVGSGTVECAHGVLDIPAPATAAILERFNIPVQATRLEGELCTPTSAALIAHFVKEFHE